MNKSFFLNMKSIFFDSGNKPFKKRIGTMKPKIVCITIIAFVSFFAAGCNGNNSTTENKKKTDTVFVQQNNQRGEGEGMDGNRRGMGDDNKGTDSMHRGMGHGSSGMDSIHQRRHN